jgi:hypothetical protein
MVLNGIEWLHGSPWSASVLTGDRVAPHMVLRCLGFRTALQRAHRVRRRSVGSIRYYYSCGCAGACSVSIAVSGAEAVQAARMGMYTKVANLMQGGRPVYQRVGSTVAYLFYWPSTTEWRIGGSYSTGTANLKSTGGGGAACPDQATGWQAYTGGVWVSTYPITVAQTTVGNAPATPACGL